MREENRNWFVKWEEELPSPEELMPLSQTLITADLALAFDIQNPNHHGTKKNPPAISHQLQQSTTPPPPPPPTSSTMADFGADSAELASGALHTGDEPARTLKRPRLVWTPQLHKRFVEAVAHLGIKNAVPKTIMQLMSVEGLTRENVASHLQKYRLYLRRMQGLSGGNGNGNTGICGGNSGHVSDPATDHLFASAPVPAHFLSPSRVSSDHFLPTLVPVATQQQIVVAQNLQPQQYHNHRQAKQKREFDYPFLGIYANQQQSQGVYRMGRYVEDLDSANGNNGGGKILTLFPTGND